MIEIENLRINAKNKKKKKCLSVYYLVHHLPFKIDKHTCLTYHVIIISNNIIFELLNLTNLRMRKKSLLSAIIYNLISSIA